MTTTTQAHIRWMIARDRPGVLRIERASFDSPWADRDFVKCMRQRNCIGMVAEANVDTEFGDLLGYMVYTLNNNDLTLLNFAVDPRCRRQGIGKRMMGKLTAKLTVNRRTRIIADVRESNIGAHLFFRAMGFECVSILRDHYETGEDAYRFVYFREAA